VHGKFLSAQPNGTLEWNRDAAKEWETFEFIRVKGDVYNIRSHNGKCLCVEPNGDKVVVNRDKPAQWEQSPCRRSAAASSR
jgi:hypothetical protein